MTPGMRLVRGRLGSKTESIAPGQT